MGPLDLHTLVLVSLSSPVLCYNTVGRLSNIVTYAVTVFHGVMRKIWGFEKTSVTDRLVGARMAEPGLVQVTK